VKELEGKLDPADRATIEDELSKFKKVREGGRAGEIKPAMDAFSEKTYAIFGKVYQKTGGGPGDAGGPGSGNAGGGYTAGPQSDDGTVESDFTDNK